MEMPILDGEQRIAISKKYQAEHPDPELIAESDFGYIQRLLKGQRDDTQKRTEMAMLRWVVSELSKINNESGDLKTLDSKFQFLLKDCKDLAELEGK